MPESFSSFCHRQLLSPRFWTAESSLRWSPYENVPSSKSTLCAAARKAISNEHSPTAPRTRCRGLAPGPRQWIKVRPQPFVPPRGGVEVIVDLNKVTQTAPSPTIPKRSCLLTKGPWPCSFSSIPLALEIAAGSHSHLVSPLYILCFIPRSSRSAYPPSSGPVGLSGGFFLAHSPCHGLLAIGKPHTAQLTGPPQTSPGPAP